MITLAAVIEVQSDGFHQDSEVTSEHAEYGDRHQERGIGHSGQVSCGGVEGHADSIGRTPAAKVADLTMPLPSRVATERTAFRPPSEYQASPAGKISEATSHLRVALLQIEDEIVKQHVSEALKILEEA
jgi:hypothetical protein